MGTDYYGVCQDCREYIDLDKFYSWSALEQAEIQDFEQPEFREALGRYVYFLPEHVTEVSERERERVG